MIIASACLVGIPCKYNGGDNRHPRLAELYDAGLLLPLCPEQLGGSPTPRSTAEISGGDGHDVLRGAARVLNSDGDDITARFIAGAEHCLKIAQAAGIKTAILKERSPSCGVERIYDGSFSRTVIPGCGVTAALLQANGINVYSETTGAEIIREVDE